MLDAVHECKWSSVNFFVSGWVFLQLSV